MKFDKIIEHLGEHGFVTRASWGGNITVAFGMDNVMYASHGGERKSPYRPSLADMKADDWMILSFFWDGPHCDHLPFDGSEPSRVWRRLLGVEEHEMSYRKQEVA